MISQWRFETVESLMARSLRLLEPTVKVSRFTTNSRPWSGPLMTRSLVRRTRKKFSWLSPLASTRVSAETLLVRSSVISASKITHAYSCKQQ
jgi:hypothetical protein